MTNLDRLVKGLTRAISVNSPTILTALAVAGVITTTVMAVRATPEAMRIVEQEAANRSTFDFGFRPWDFTPLERLQLTWRCYIPAAGMGLTTIGCIVGVNSIHLRRNAALASVYSITETALKEYQDRVVEHIGEAAERKVRDSIDEDHIKAHPISSSEVIVASRGDMLCYETTTGRYFTSDIETMRKAQNDINAQILLNMYASQNEFYELIGLPSVALGEDLGWNIDKMLELSFSSMIAEDDRPCLVVNYRIQPITNYYHVH